MECDETQPTVDDNWDDDITLEIKVSHPQCPEYRCRSTRTAPFMGKYRCWDCGKVFQ